MDNITKGGYTILEVDRILGIFRLYSCPVVFSRFSIVTSLRILGPTLKTLIVRLTKVLKHASDIAMSMVHYKTWSTETEY
jgi:hypothetical protein